MAAPIERMFPSASHFVAVNPAATKDKVCQKQELLLLKCPKNTSKVLLSGIHGCGKTALLFQYAQSCAMEGHRVAFITQRKLDCMPVPVEGAPKPDPLLMKQVQIMYFEDRDSLLQYLAGIHTANSPPDVLIVDNLDYYVTHPKCSDQTTTIGILCAFLVDAATFLTNERCKKSDKDTDQHDCQMLASVSTQMSGDFPQESFYTYFLPSLLRIRGVKELGNVFQLTLNQDGTSETMQTITYEIKDCIRLLDISNHGNYDDSMNT